MKLRRVLVSTVTLGALLLPNAAIADDVHITIGVKHVQRDGVRKLKVSGQLHLLSGAPESCRVMREINIQRRKNSGAAWNKVGDTGTHEDGRYSKVVKHRQGQYRAVAKATSSCEKDSSSAVNHFH
jgi:hypothetical protein